jgi:hypothetical protein
MKIKLSKRIDLICFLGPVQKLVTSKSAYHLRLEQALKKNKKAIFRSQANGLLIDELREQAHTLTTVLAVEIKREFEEEQEFCKSEKIFYFNW